MQMLQPYTRKPSDGGLNSQDFEVFSVDGRDGESEYRYRGLVLATNL